MVELPESIRPLFLAAGWQPGRRVAVSPAVPTDHPAAAILATFGGLTVSRPAGAERAECSRDAYMLRDNSSAYRSKHLVLGARAQPRQV